MSLADRPRVQFAAMMIGAGLVLFGVIWTTAGSGSDLPAWIPDEGVLFFGGLTFAAAFAAWGLNFSTWPDVFWGATIGMVVASAIYFLPLVFLMRYPLGSTLFLVLPAMAALFVLYGAAILAAICLRLGHRPGGMT